MAPSLKRILIRRQRNYPIVVIGVGTSAKSQEHGEPEEAIRHIRHVIVIMQENSSFDSYFGAFPGADGIPMRNGEPAVCVPDPASGACVKPYDVTQGRNGGGPHSRGSAIEDVDGGKMDGFIKLVKQARIACHDRDDPACVDQRTPDVMGYHDGGYPQLLGVCEEFCVAGPDVRAQRLLESAGTPVPRD